MPSASWELPAGRGCCAFMREQSSGQPPDRSPGRTAASCRSAVHAVGDAPAGMPGRRDRSEFQVIPASNWNLDRAWSARSAVASDLMRNRVQPQNRLSPCGRKRTFKLSSVVSDLLGRLGRQFL